MGRVCVRGALVVAFFSLCASVHADQARDWMVAAPPGGTRLMLDMILPGEQLTLEHREPIYGIANDVAVRASHLYTLAFLDHRLDVDLRVLFLGIGVGAGYRNTFRTLQFDPGQPLSLESRRSLDRSGFVEAVNYPWIEGRASMALPFNDWLVLLNTWTLRREDRPRRSYDWRYGVVHDGSPVVSDLWLFLKHRDVGAVAPLLQVLNFDRDGGRHTQVNWGLTYVTRTGILLRDDIFLFQILFHTGDQLGGQDFSDQYGFHLFRAPFNFIVAHRMVFELYAGDAGEE